MIEITLTEMVLFAWAVLATAAAFKYKEEDNRSRMVLMAVMQDKGLRDKLVAAYQDFIKEQKI